MEREKEIEEMIRDYYHYDEFIPSDDLQEAIKKGGYINIVNLYDAGYRKIPEDAVVITENNALAIINAILLNSTVTDAIAKLVEKEKEQARKETAREIYFDSAKAIQTAYGAFDEIDALKRYAISTVQILMTA